MKSKIVARAKNLRLRFNRKCGKFNMTGGSYGNHYLYAGGYTDRVNVHWKGYIKNNGIKWIGHPEFFPRPRQERS